MLAFPGLFRGLLDADSGQTTDEMLRVAAVAIAEMLRVAAVAIAEMVSDEERNPAYIIPGVFDSRVAKAVAAAVQSAIEGDEGHQ